MPQAGPGNQLRGRRSLTCLSSKSQADLAGPPRAGQGRQSAPAQGAAGRRARREPEARLGPQQQRPHHDAAQGRRPQAALPDRRLQAQQGRHPGEGRAARVRPEPQRAPRAPALRRRRAPLHDRAARRRGRARSCSRARRRRSSRATACRCATSRSARRSTASRCCRARARRSRARPAPACSCSRAKASTRSCACARARSARCTSNCRATIGEVGNEEHNLRSIGKAGANRWRGIRPTVRGDLDEPGRPPDGRPHNGGGGRHHPVSPWGTPAKGYKTRKNKRTRLDDRAPPAREEGLMR